MKKQTFNIYFYECMRGYSIKVINTFHEVFG